jgi:CheY-like chemotaxis protein
MPIFRTFNESEGVDIVCADDECGRKHSLAFLLHFWFGDARLYSAPRGVSTPDSGEVGKTEVSDFARVSARFVLFELTAAQGEGRRTETMQDLEARRWRVGVSSRLSDGREGLGCPRVLLAEDHDGTREALKMLLELNGYEVFAAKDGEEALRIALQTWPDVVITDFDMPHLDGVGLTRQLRAISSQMHHPVILIVTAVSRAIVERALEAGVDAYIAKPVDFQTLEATLRTLVEH